MLCIEKQEGGNKTKKEKRIRRKKKIEKEEIHELEKE